MGGYMHCMTLNLILLLSEKLKQKTLLITIIAFLRCLSYTELRLGVIYFMQ